MSTAPSIECDTGTWLSWKSLDEHPVLLDVRHVGDERLSLPAIHLAEPRPDVRGDLREIRQQQQEHAIDLRHLAQLARHENEIVVRGASREIDRIAERGDRLDARGKLRADPVLDCRRAASAR